MFSDNYLLMAKEGALMQGCFKAAFTLLNAGSNANRGPLYASFFMYSVGLERLLKLSLILDHSSQNGGKMPPFSVLRGFGHDVCGLYQKAIPLFSRYGVSMSPQVKLVALDDRIMRFASGFATFDRYFNLDALTGGGKSEDPLPEWHGILWEIYRQDAPIIRRDSNEEQVEAMVQQLQPMTVYVEQTGLDDNPQTMEEFFQDDARIRLVLPWVKWRLLKPIVPFRQLLTDLSHGEGVSTDIPGMEEFVDFIHETKEGLLADHDWPGLE